MSNPEWDNYAPTATDVLNAHRAEVEKLREALRFYAEETNYRTTSTGFAAQYDPATPAIEADSGHKAREALGGCHEPKCRPCHRPATY